MCKDVTMLLCELIQIPSVNPTGNPGTTEVNEERIAAYVADFLKAIGADEVRLIPVKPNRPNVFARFCGGRVTGSKGKGKRERVAFAPHTDTVSVEGMTIDPFKPTIKNGKIYGRGSTDTKGPMAAMLWALKQWACSRERIQSGREVLFYGLMGEEAGNEGAIAMARNEAARANFVVVGEPTEHRIVHAHKGAIWMELEVRGKACHASMPERGKNAIVEMVGFLVELSKGFPGFLRKFKSPILGQPTFNIGIIRGGSKVNIVPDRCVVELDCRSVPGLRPAEILSYIRAMAKRCGVRVVARVTGHKQAMHVPAENVWIERLRPVAKKLEVAPWFCDAAIFAQAGIPAVAYGPGSIRQAHTVDEYILAKDLEEGTHRYGRFLASL